MARWVRFAVVAVAAGLVFGARGHIGRLLRTIDQRAGVFAPRGAGLYNAVAPAILRPLYRRVAEDVEREVGLGRLAQISSVLEIGSGPGELAIEIARRLPGGDVVGIDLAPAMVDRATERARATGLGDRVRFELADAAAMPTAAASIDVVASTLSLHHWSDPAAVFSEIGRVLHPGGVALIYDLRPFAYTRHELEVFLAGGPFEGVHLERERFGSGLLAAVFVRIRVIRPSPA